MDIRTLMEGLAAGDALGVTSEFKSLEEVRLTYLLQKSSGWPFEPIGGGPFGFRARRPTDDAEMALAIVNAWAESVEEEGVSPRFDGERIAANFVKWLESGPRDIGMTTRATLKAVQAGTPWHQGGLKFWRRTPKAWSNGSLMRNGVVAGTGEGDYEIFRHTLFHGLITHWAPLPAICCAAQSWLIHNGEELGEQLWEGEAGSEVLSSGWKQAFRTRWDFWLCTDDDPVVKEWRDTTWADHEDAWQRFMAADFSPDSFRPFAPIEHLGFCLTTLQIGVWAMQWAYRDQPYPTEYLPEKFPTEPFLQTGAEVLSWVAMIGRDSDTYGATAGPMIATVKDLRRDLVDRLGAVEDLPAEIPYPQSRFPWTSLSFAIAPGWSSEWEELHLPRIIQLDTEEEFDHYTSLQEIAKPYSMAAFDPSADPKVVAHVTSAFVVVAEVAYTWRGSHELCIDPVPMATRRTQDATKEWLLESIEEAKKRRQESYISCDECGKVFPPESGMGEICHGCMEKNGVVF